MYGILLREALTVAWEASGYVCSERLQPFLGELVPLLERHGDLTIDADTRGLLLAASVSTVERAVATVRRSTTTRRMSQTKPGTLLRRQIPAGSSWRRGGGGLCAATTVRSTLSPWSARLRIKRRTTGAS
jgi:hypothetical protein